MLKAQGRSVVEIRLKALLKSDDYSQYVMLEKPDKCGEIVVNSRQMGHVCLEPDCMYTPETRLYFDVNKTMHDGVAVRYGVPIIKDSLSLKNI